MKTFISIPDPVFQGAEQLAKRSGKSRSRLYTDAMIEYLARHSPDAVTAAMDRVCAEVGSAPDEFVSAASSRILKHIKW